MIEGMPEPLLQRPATLKHQIRKPCCGVQDERGWGVRHYSVFLQKMWVED